MNNDSMRLSDLIPAYTRQYKCGNLEATYALQELFTELDHYHKLKYPYKAIPDDLCWVGRTEGPTRARKTYKIYFFALMEYFSNLMASNPSSEANFVKCLCTSEKGDTENIPHGILYLSKSLLGKLIYEVTHESLGFLFDEEVGKDSCESSEDGLKVFQGKELVSIQGLARGLIEIIIEVDRAHRGVSAKLDPEAILDFAQKLGLKSSSSEWYETLAALAKAVEVEDFRSNRKTLKRYIGNRL